MNGTWVREPVLDCSVVFVHGLFSSSEKCWGGKPSWPELLAGEPILSNVGIYAFNYFTNIFSGTYDINDAVDALNAQIELDGLSRLGCLIFVCHSMGGLVVRQFLVDRALQLRDRSIKLGLFLVASPSLGSEYADWLKALAKLLGHRQSQALGLIKNNQWLFQLNRRFLDLRESGHLEIRGKELVEDKFVVLKRFWHRQVVPPFAGAMFFGNAIKIPDSDHFTICKPKNREALQHRLLCQFIKENIPALLRQEDARHVGPHTRPTVPSGPEASREDSLEPHTRDLGLPALPPAEGSSEESLPPNEVALPSAGLRRRAGLDFTWQPTMGAYLKETRQARGKTRADVAAAVGLGRAGAASLKRYEAGAPPPLETLFTLCQYYSIEVDVFRRMATGSGSLPAVQLELHSALLRDIRMRVHRGQNTEVIGPPGMGYDRTWESLKRCLCDQYEYWPVVDAFTTPNFGSIRREIAQQLFGEPAIGDDPALLRARCNSLQWVLTVHNLDALLEWQSDELNRLFKIGAPVLMFNMIAVSDLVIMQGHGSVDPPPTLEFSDPARCDRWSEWVAEQSRLIPAPRRKHVKEIETAAQHHPGAFLAGFYYLMNAQVEEAVGQVKREHSAVATSIRARLPATLRADFETLIRGVAPHEEANLVRLKQALERAGIFLNGKPRVSEWSRQWVQQ